MTKRIIAVFLVICILLSFGACQKKGGDDTAKPETTEKAEKGPSALDVFSDAANDLSKKTELVREISVKTERSVGNQVYTETSDCTADFINIGGEDFKAVATEKKVIESGIIDTVEIYSDGKVYCRYGDAGEGTFVADIDSEAFISRWLPFVIIDSELYKSAKLSKDKRSIIFSDAKGLEKWLAPEYSDLITAGAEVMLSDKNEITQMIYTVEYRRGPAQISSEYTVKISENRSAASESTVPAIEECIALCEVDIPMYLAYAKNGIESSAAIVGGTNMEMILPEAGVAYSSGDSYSLYSGDDVFLSKIDRDITIQDIQGVKKANVVEEYKDKKATQSVDGGEPAETKKKPADFKSYIKDDLTTFLYEPTEYSNAEVTHTGEFVLVEYEISNESEIGISCEDYISEFLYGDADFFDSITEGYATNEISGYLALDMDTFLPTAVGFTYKGSHILEGQTLNMNLYITQSVACATDRAYTNVTDEYPPKEEPEKKATPLLYEVTGDNGAKMYLLGTIHIADERAAYLPDELYAALDEADVLAVEIDDTFNDQISQDEKLLEMARESYYYQDGTTIKDHVSEDIYKYGVKAMKIAGQYTSFSDMMRPTLWSQTIDYFLMDSSMVLESYMGIDERLRRIAKESDKEIRAVETVEGRLSMELSYPEKAHEMVLEDSVSFSRSGLIEGSLEMYELWCEGDEKKLTEYIREGYEIPEDATEEEIKAYEEYNRIMLTDRDAIMIAKAKEYLANTNEVVFFAVGTAHVLGETGLVDALREAGYTVTPVEYK